MSSWPPVERCGVFTRREARSAGWSRGQVTLRIQRGDWVRVLGSAYVVADTPVSHLARCWAAVLDANSSAVVTGASALALHGLDAGDARISLASRRLRPKGRPEVVICQETVPSEAIVVLDDGLLVADRQQALLDGLRALPLPVAQRVLDEALRLRWLDAAWLAGKATAATGRRGAPQLAALARTNAVGGLYPAERLLHGLLRGAGISGWRANCPITDAAGLIGLGDVVFARERLVLEVDGRAHHTAKDRFQADRSKQNRLVVAGWIVLRFTWDDLTRRPAEVVRLIGEALACARSPLAREVQRLRR